MSLTADTSSNNNNNNASESAAAAGKTTLSSSSLPTGSQNDYAVFNDFDPPPPSTDAAHVNRPTAFGGDKASVMYEPLLDNEKNLSSNL